MNSLLREQVADIIDKIMCNHSGWMDMLFPDKDALLQFGWDCMNLSFYNPDEEMRELLEQIARSEGMFFQKGITVIKSHDRYSTLEATAMALNL